MQNHPMPAPVVVPAAQPPQAFGGGVQVQSGQVPVSQRPTQRQLLPGVGQQPQYADPTAWVAQQQQQQMQQQQLQQQQLQQQQQQQLQQQQQQQQLQQQQSQRQYQQPTQQQSVANIRSSESLSDSLEGVSRGIKQIITQQCRYVVVVYNS